MPPRADIVRNLHAVRRRLEAAAHRVSRSADEITLVAISKTFPIDDVATAVEAGQRVFGENRVQEAEAKIEAFRPLELDWHLVGHLQSNKAKRAATLFSCIESLDSLELLEKIDRAAQQAGTAPRILIQADLANETTKFGADEGTSATLVRAALAARAVSLAGLMIIPPSPEHPENSRPWFRRLRELRDRLVSDGIPAEHLRELSMGMSHDFEVAIEEGATMVRVGTAIFGYRPPASPAAAPPS
jgi:pyridoxal phosphate enzyme (YggS family)